MPFGGSDPRHYSGSPLCLSTGGDENFHSPVVVVVVVMRLP